MKSRFRARRLGPVALLLALLMAASFVACSRKDPGKDVMAVVNGHKILASDVDKYYLNAVAGAPQQPSAEEAANLRLNVLRSLIDDEVLMQRAERLGLTATSEEVDSKLTEFKAPYTEEQFKNLLKQRNITLEDFRRDLTRNITKDKLFNKEITSRITVTDADLSNYYNAHKPEFNLVEPQYHVLRILVTTEPNPQIRNKAPNEAAARKKIQEIVNRLDSGEDFATLAANMSEDPDTAPNGGEVAIPESALKNTDAGTRDALLKLRPGQHSDIITISDRLGKVAGFQIIKLLEKLPAGQRDLNDPQVQVFIRNQLRNSREQLLRAAYLETLHDQAKVENYYADQILKGQK